MLQHSFNSTIDTLILLLLAHFVCDFTLQNDRMAIEKVQGKDVTLNWRWWLFAHCSTHALAVILFTSSTLLGIFELIMHWIIDFFKGKKYYSLFVDQLLHVICKLIWCFLLKIVI